ncbi:MAG: hypothetical protein HYY51_02125 [Candidatus Magasanikbacteria bacterium]|nr:hypothetical protein [Candidatus Magasanikbacteria bacterium]
MGETSRFAAEPGLRKPSEPKHDDHAISPGEEEWFETRTDLPYPTDPQETRTMVDWDGTDIGSPKESGQLRDDRPRSKLERRKRYSQEEADVLVGDLASVAAELKQEPQAASDTKPRAGQNKDVSSTSLKEVGIKLEVLGNNLNLLKRLQSMPDDNAEKQLHLRQMGFPNNLELETRIDQVQKQIMEAQEHRNFLEIAPPTDYEKEHGNTGFDQAAWFADEDEAPRVVERILREKGEQQLEPEDFDEMNERL